MKAKFVDMGNEGEMSEREMRDIRESFNMFDINKDGTVTIDEIRTTLGISADEDSTSTYGITNQVNRLGD